MELLNLKFTKNQIKEKNTEIFDKFVIKSSHLKDSNYSNFQNYNLMSMYSLYDELYFQRRLENLFIPTTLSKNNLEISILELNHDTRKNGTNAEYLRLVLSNRLTKVDAKVSMYSGKLANGYDLRWFSFKISSSLLHLTFSNQEKVEIVYGFECTNRIEVLQRIFEHHLVHLLEFKYYNHTVCGGNKFSKIIQNIFGHTRHHHHLKNQKQRSEEKYNITIGDIVSFIFEGESLSGEITNITKRATVIVESENGDYKIKGKFYSKYYIPLPLLSKLKK